jgi:tryptophan synthase beta chain
VSGRFGAYGGQFVAETLVPPLEELYKTYLAAQQDPTFTTELETLLSTFVGRPTPITRLRRMGIEPYGITIWLKREDLAHTGAHKINNAVGQVLLAQRMGKRRIIAETGAGQHGVAVAAACAYLGMPATIFMGRVDAERQLPNVQRMRLLGAEVRLVGIGTGTLKDAISEAIREWLADPDHTHYLLGSAVGPHPFPTIVREFQSVIGTEARAQFLAATNRLPDAVVACVGGGSNSIGIFSSFFEDPVRLVGVQAYGDGTGRPGAHAAPLLCGAPGVIQGMRTYLVQDDDGQVLLTRSIAPGLDYPGVGPQHSQLKDQGRVEYIHASDDEALDSFQALARLEGIVPALESAHAVAGALRLAAELEAGSEILVNLSGRGDKDLDSAMAALEDRQEKPHA